MFAALAHPLVLSTVASILPSVISALIGSPTEDEAKARVAPERDAMVDRIAGTGMERKQAEKLADELITGRVHEEMNKGGIPPWLEGAAAIAGGLGGWKAGSWLSGKLANRAAGSLAKTAAGASKTADAVGAAYGAGKGLAPEAAAAAAPAVAAEATAAAKTGPFVKPTVVEPVEVAAGDHTKVRGPFAWAEETKTRDPFGWANQSPEAEAARVAEKESAIEAAKRFSQREDEIRRGTIDSVGQVEAREKAAQMAAMRQEADMASGAPDPRDSQNWPRGMKTMGPFAGSRDQRSLNQDDIDALVAGL